MPTTIVGPSTSILEIDADRDVLPGGGRANDRADRLGRPSTPPDHFAELARADRHGIDGPTLIERLVDANGIGVVDELTAQELDELPHVSPRASPARPPERCPTQAFRRAR